MKFPKYILLTFLPFALDRLTWWPLPTCKEIASHLKPLVEALGGLWTKWKQCNYDMLWIKEKQLEEIKKANQYKELEILRSELECAVWHFLVRSELVLTPEYLLKIKRKLPQEKYSLSLQAAKCSIPLKQCSAKKSLCTVRRADVVVRKLFQLHFKCSCVLENCEIVL